MKHQPHRFIFLAAASAWLALVPSIWGQTPSDSQSPPPAVAPPSPVPIEPSLAPDETSSSAVIKMPPFEVTAPKEKSSSLEETFEKLNHAFDGPFPSLRSGPLIEAILWRHRYLTDYPNEEAAIVTTERGSRIISATTVYTKGGKVYGSSNALGENLLIPGLTAADLHSPDGLARTKQYIIAVRGDYSRAAIKFTSVGYDGDVTNKTRRDTNAPGQSIKALLVRAEDSGDYSILAAAAGAPQQFVLTPGASYSASVPASGVNPSQTDAEQTLIRAVVPLIQAQRDKANYELGQTAVQTFSQPATEILSWTYKALHNPTRAGLVPVALTRVNVDSAAMTISPFDTNNNSPLSSLQQHDIISTKEHVRQNVQAIIFDWKGVQYLYQPDIGTQAKPLPINPLTQQPYLCVKNGALLECAYFCATYAKEHLDEKAVLLPGNPVLAAYQKEGKLGLFIPALGNFTLPQDYASAIDDNDSLGQIRDQLVALQKQKNAAADAIPEQVTGDDADMQMRRAFLAFQAAGITSQLKEEEAPSLDFTWDGVAYVYGPDQQVHLAPAE